MDEDARTRLLLEAMDSKFAMIAEMIRDLPTRAEIDARFRAIEDRLAVIEAIARKNNEDVQRLAEQLERLNEETRAIRADLEVERAARRADSGVLASLERRVAAIEERLGITPSA